MEAAIAFVVDGERVELRFGELDARMVRKIRTESGLAPMQAFRMLVAGDADLDVFASLFYAAKLQAGDSVRFEEIVGRVSYGGFEFEQVESESPKDFDDPEI